MEVRHARAATPEDRDLGREAWRRMDELEERMAERLEVAFGEATQIGSKEQERLGRTAEWLRLEAKRETAGDEVETAHEVWSNVTSMASVELLRAAVGIAGKRSGVGPVAIGKQELVEETWARLDKVRFIGLTGLSEDESYRGLGIAAEVLIDWAREEPAVLFQDDIEVVIRERDRKLEVVVRAKAR